MDTPAVNKLTTIDSITLTPLVRERQPGHGRHLQLRVTSDHVLLRKRTSIRFGP